MAVALAYTLAISICLTQVMSAPNPDSATEEVDLQMNGVQPQEADTYLCKSMKIDEAHKYIKGFTPKADSRVAHHILLYGCDEPGMQPGRTWNCGEMSKAKSEFKQENICHIGFNILYAWAMDAPKLPLPPGVSFDVGQDTPTKYLVLQVHYKNVSRFLPPVNGTDTSGVTLEMTTTPTPKQAGVYLMVTGGQIPAHSIEYFEAACDYNDQQEIVPFAYRTHAHTLGRVISGYRIRDGEWTEIGRKDPRLPEMFYNVTNPGMTVRRGDILAARCTLENTLAHTVNIGPTQDDEMCNFYIMYYVEHSPVVKESQCVSSGPPYWYWKDYSGPQTLNIDGTPSTASVIPATTKALKRNATYSNLATDEEDDEEGSDSEKIVPGMPGEFQDGNTEQIVDEALEEMSPDELLFLVQQLALEEDEAEARERMWRQRQMMRERRLFPYRSQY